MIKLFTSDEIRIFQGGEIPEKVLAHKLSQVIKAVNQLSGDISEVVERELQDPTSPSHAAVVEAAEAAAAEMADSKQDKLTAGSGINIQNNVISATNEFDPDKIGDYLELTDEGVLKASVSTLDPSSCTGNFVATTAANDPLYFSRSETEIAKDINIDGVQYYAYTSDETGLMLSELNPAEFDTWKTSNFVAYRTYDDGTTIGSSYTFPVASGEITGEYSDGLAVMLDVINLLDKKQSNNIINISDIDFTAEGEGDIITVACTILGDSPSNKEKIKNILGYTEWPTTSQVYEDYKKNTPIVVRHRDDGDMAGHYIFNVNSVTYDDIEREGYIPSNHLFLTFTLLIPQEVDDQVYNSYLEGYIELYLGNSSFFKIVNTVYPYSIIDLINFKQNRLTAGDGIKISGNTISSTVPNLTAGECISVSDNKINAVVKYLDKLSEVETKKVSFFYYPSVTTTVPTEYNNVTCLGQKESYIGGLEYFWLDASHAVKAEEALDPNTNLLILDTRLQAYAYAGGAIRLLEGQSFVIKSYTTAYTDNALANVSDVKNHLNLKQDKLTAGSGISISDDNVISAEATEIATLPLSFFGAVNAIGNDFWLDEAHTKGYYECDLNGQMENLCGYLNSELESLLTLSGNLLKNAIMDTVLLKKLYIKSKQLDASDCKVDITTHPSETGGVTTLFQITITSQFYNGNREEIRTIQLILPFEGPSSYKSDTKLIIKQDVAATEEEVETLVSGVSSSKSLVLQDGALEVNPVLLADIQAVIDEVFGGDE